MFRILVRFLSIIPLVSINFSDFVFAQVSADFGGLTGGAVRVGDSSSTCDSSTEGAIKFDPLSDSFEACDGLNWRVLIVAACPNNLPNNWGFVDLTNQSTSTTVESSIHQVTGITGCTVSVKVSGDGAPEFRVCSDASCTAVVQTWTSTEAAMTDGQYIQLRLNTPITGNTQSNVHVIVGARSESWSVTTAGNCGDPSPPPGTLCADGTVYAGLSPDGSTKMYTTPCDYGEVWDGSNCGGSETEYAWSTNTSIFHNLNANTGEANTTALATSVDADSPYPAAGACYNLNYGGKSDWYLPSINEADVLISACAVLPDWGCSNVADFWTSNDLSTSNAWQREKDGTSINSAKSQIERIRCVRKD